MVEGTDIQVDVIDHLGDDLRVVNAARVSFDRQKSEIDEQDIRLIAYLANHEHWTPFSHAVVTLRESVPIFVARQRFKHTIGFSYNEVSRRYVSGAPQFHVPTQWRARPHGNIKQGSRPGDALDQAHWHEALAGVHQMAQALYSEMIDAGVAPEQARMVLPQSTMTSYFVTGSLAAWARAYRLRIADSAQLEIRELAERWSGALSPLFPHCWKALISTAPPARLVPRNTTG